MADRRFKVKKRASEQRPHITMMVIIVLLLAGSAALFWPPQERIHQGLDVQGGLSVVLQADKTDGSAISAAEMQTAQEVVERRVNLLGASEASVQVQGSNQLMVQIPGAVDQTDALNVIGQAGVLEFVDLSKLSDTAVTTAMNNGTAISRDQLAAAGLLGQIPDLPVNAELFIQASASTTTDSDSEAADGDSEGAEAAEGTEGDTAGDAAAEGTAGDAAGDAAAEGADAEAADGDAETSAADADTPDTTEYSLPSSMYVNPLATSSYGSSDTSDLPQVPTYLPVAQLVISGNYTPLKLTSAYTDAIIFSGINITQVTVGKESETSPYYAVNLVLDDIGAESFAEATTRLYPTKGKVMIVLDGYPQSAPAVQNAITNGKVAITGNYTVDQANQLRTVLQSGSLPVSLSVISAQVVGPTLGQDALKAGVLVAIIGLILVALYLLIFYRGLGLLTAAAIAVFAVLYLGVLALLSYFNFFSLSLSGIAGIVLAIGVAADSSILVLERFKEEIRMGRSVRAASVTGVRHAIQTSIDADLVTAVSALALFFIATGSVKGFGLTLVIGVACDILTMVMFKAPLIRLLAPAVMARHMRFWGVQEDEDFAHAAGEMKRGEING